MLGDLLLVPILVSKVIGGGGGGGSRGAAGLVAGAGRGAGGRRRRWGGELRQDCKKFCCLWNKIGFDFDDNSEYLEEGICGRKTMLGIFKAKCSYSPVFPISDFRDV